MTITTAAKRDGKLATTVKSVPPGLLRGPNAILISGRMAQPAKAAASAQSPCVSRRRAACQKTNATERYTAIMPSSGAIDRCGTRAERAYNPNHNPIRKAARAHGREFEYIRAAQKNATPLAAIRDLASTSSQLGGEGFAPPIQ